MLSFSPILFISPPPARGGRRAERVSAKAIQAGGSHISPPPDAARCARRIDLPALGEVNYGAA
jgi:hypothetical protein